MAYAVCTTPTCVCSCVCVFVRVCVCVCVCVCSCVCTCTCAIHILYTMQCVCCINAAQLFVHPYHPPTTSNSPPHIHPQQPEIHPSLTSPPPQIHPLTHKPTITLMYTSTDKCVHAHHARTQARAYIYNCACFSVHERSCTCTHIATLQPVMLIVQCTHVTKSTRELCIQVHMHTYANRLQGLSQEDVHAESFRPVRAQGTGNADQGGATCQACSIGVMLPGFSSATEQVKL